MTYLNTVFIGYVKPDHQLRAYIFLDQYIISMPPIPFSAALDQLASTSVRVRMFCGFVAAVLISRCHVYRRIKPLIFPFSVGYVMYWSFYDPTAPTLYTILGDELARLGSLPLRSALGNVLGLVLVLTTIRLINQIFSVSLQSLPKKLMNWGFSLVQNTGPVQALMKKEQDKIEASFEESLKSKARALGSSNTVLPKKGWKKSPILNLMKSAVREESQGWEAGKVSGAIYHGQHKHIELLNEAFSQYSVANALHPDMWPSVTKFESEIVAMTASLVSSGVDASSVCGCTTSVRF